MPYLGNELATQFQAFVTQTITGDGSTGYTLDRAVANGKELLVYINNVKQEEGSGKSYTASGTTITFSEAVASTDSCYVVFLGSAVQTVVPSEGSVTSAMLSKDTSGNLTLDIAGDITLDADGADVKVADNGTDFGKFSSTNADLNIHATVQDADIVFRGDDGGSAIEAVRIDMSAGGKVGIGTNSPATALDVDGGANSDQATFSGTASRGLKISTFSVGAADEGVDFDAQASGSTQALTFSTGGTERVRVDGSGVLRIANTSGTLFNSSSATGTIAGTSLQVATDGSTVAFFNRLSSDGQVVGFYKDGGQIGAVTCFSNDNICFGSTVSGHAGLQFGGAISPMRPVGTSNDGNVSLGASNERFDTVFATSGSINTSDKNEKQDIASLTDKELNVAKKLSTLFKTYRWIDRVAEKGDKARTHTGIIAQEIQAAFSAEGLDASKYGLYTSDTWWEKEISVDAVEADKEKGIEAKDAYTYMDFKDEKTDGYTERTRLGVRYIEVFSFIFSSIEARLTALESK